MSLLAHYREAYEYEKDCNRKMLAMIETVPQANQSDPRFQQAVTLAGHLVACRENWLDFMGASGHNQTAWWDERCDSAALPPRFAALERRWTDYLMRLDEDQWAQEFEFTEANGECFRLPAEVQIVQLAGHASYHRGQVALLVSQLGGETQDTDYADWWFVNRQKA